MAGPPLVRGRSGQLRDDRGKIYLAKTTRAVAYGALSAFLFLYLANDLGFSVLSSLVVTALSLVGAAAWNLLVLPPLEGRMGRRRSIAIFSALFLVSAILLFLATSPALVIVAVLLGGVAAATADNGPLASLDQSILPSTLRRADLTAGFAWYNLLANFASAAGALLLVVPGALTNRSIPLLPGAPHPWVLLVYVALAGATMFAYSGLSPAAESGVEPQRGRRALTAESTRRVRDLGALFAVDSFAGGLVINPLIAAYFVLAWRADSAEIGVILFATGLVAGVSFLLADWFVRRFGLLNTMVFTHLPSNLLLIAVPFMPTFGLAVGVLIARTSLSQMDVPTRQSYSMSLVAPNERSTAAGVLGGSRALAQSAGPFPATAFEAGGLLALPFVLAGALKVAYDLAVWQRFRRVPLPAEVGDAAREPTSSGERRRG